MNRFDYLILSVMERAGSLNPVSAMTVREIIEAEDCGYKENTVFKKLKEMIVSGYVSKGMKDGRADTFYITASGRELLENVRRKGDKNEK